MSINALSPWRHPRFETGGAFVSLFVALVISVQYVYYYIFSKFQGYDDEGYFLVGLKSFFGGQALYDQIYSIYGPFFYVFDRLVFSLWGAPVCHDSIRLFTIVLWLTAAAVNAFIVYRLTTSTLLSVFIYVVSVNYLQAFAFEPGHPQALAYLLVAGIVALFASWTRISRASFSLVVGVLVSLLLLTKINIGVYALLAVGLVLSTGTAGVVGLRLQRAIGAVMVALPVALIYPRIISSFWSVPHICQFVSLAIVVVVPLLLRGRDRIWGFIAAALCATIILAVSQSGSLAGLYEFHFGVLLSFAAYSVVLIALASRPDAEFRYREWLLGVLGCAMAVVAILAFIFLHGTSLYGLTDGLFLGPARMFGLAGSSQGFFSSAIVPVTALAGLVACYAYVWVCGPFADRRWFHYTLAITKAVFAFLVIVNRNPSVPPMFRTMAMWLPAAIPTWPPIFLSFAWLAAVSGTQRPEERIARLGLVAMAVMQPLIAYPVSGSQCAPGGVLTFVVAAVCISDAIETFKTLIPNSIRFSWLRPVSGLIVALAILIPFYKQAVGMHRNYSSLIPLELPGASRIRLDAEDVHLYQDLVRLLARPEVDTFLTLPGMNSLYFWAQKDPPTGFNITLMMDLLDDHRQEQIWEAFSKRSGVLIVKNGKWPPRWENMPLVRHINHDFKTITTIGHYEVMGRQ